MYNNYTKMGLCLTTNENKLLVEKTEGLFYEKKIDTGGVKNILYYF